MTVRVEPMTLAQELEFLKERYQEEETSILAKAVREGIHLLYQEALVEAYLLGEIPREVLVKQLGPEKVAEIDYQRDALCKDIKWGLR